MCFQLCAVCSQPTGSFCARLFPMFIGGVKYSQRSQINARAIKKKTTTSYAGLTAWKSTLNFAASSSLWMTNVWCRHWHLWWCWKELITVLLVWLRYSSLVFVTLSDSLVHVLSFKHVCKTLWWITVIMFDIFFSES